MLRPLFVTEPSSCRQTQTEQGEGACSRLERGCPENALTRCGIDGSTVILDGCGRTGAQIQPQPVNWPVISLKSRVVDSRSDTNRQHDGRR